MSDARPLVCFALKEEAKPFVRTVASSRVRTLLTGIGRKNAERAFRAALAESRPNLVLTCGFAGGLNPKLTHGEVLFELCRSRGDETQTEIESETPHVVSYDKLISAGAREGKFHCSDHVVVTAEEKWALWQKTGADAVEMESEIIRAVCREQGIPSATVRVISDIAGEDLPLDFNALMTPAMRIDSGKLALAILRSPGKIGALLRLQKQTKLAAHKLSEVLQAVA
jgi:adenosylhomocysteine nucleosidase